MGYPYLFSWAVAAMAVTMGAIVTGTSRHAVVAASGARIPVNSLGKGQLLQSAQGTKAEAESVGKPDECKEKTAGDTPTKIVTIDEKTLQAKFACGGSFTSGTDPDTSQASTKCCRDPKCASENGQANISDILGVEGKAENKENVVTVTLATLPEDKRTAKFYYKCKSASNDAGFCLVMVALPGPLDDNQCAIDRTVAVSLSASHTTVAFKCNGKLEENPFEVKTGDSCSEQPAKGEILNLAKSDSETHTYTLGVAQLPEATTKLCYKCTYEQVPTVENTSVTKERTCTVLVTVTGKGTATPEGSETSTSTFSTSSASVAFKILRVFTWAAVALSAVIVN